MKITKREVLFSIVIICIMLIIGIIISGNINDAVMEKQQEYITALQINNDKDLFEYGMRTDVGNAFVYGELKAVDTVTFDEIGGEYSYVKKVKEKYTRHTRTVTKTRTVNGKTQTYTTTEVYWTWDEVDSWSKHSEKITFLDVEFDYGTIDFPYRSHIDTQDGGYHIRYVYYGSPTYSIGTVYTKLGDGTIANATMHHNSTIEVTLERAMKDGSVFVFWFFWIFLTGGAVCGFYYIDNRWLEDNHKRRYY
jgi:hypothetical protein